MKSKYVYLQFGNLSGSRDKIEIVLVDQDKTETFYNSEDQY